MAMTQKGKSYMVKLAAAALCLALALLLPFLTAKIPRVGNAVAPMHLPVLICGYVCGGPVGLLVGAAAPLLHSLLFAAPSMAAAIPMAAELAVYGLVTGAFYRRVFRRNAVGVYGSLLCAMLLGRAAAAVAKAVLLSMGIIREFSLSIFLADYFFTAIPAILIQLVLVPLVVMAFKKAGLVD